ncbi:MAG: SIS domain-containing protein [Clostridia bacterium]|nr:SIS domain-containing protein [Clostridia bacterium]
MAHRLLILTGWPGAGKTTTAAFILARWPGLRLLSYDAVKEEWFDREGFSSLEERAALNERSLQAYWALVDQGLSRGEELLLEYPFGQKHREALLALSAKHQAQPATILLNGDPHTLYRRYAERDRHHARHPGHYSECYHKGAAARPMPIPTEEDWIADCRAKAYDIRLGPTLRLDMTDPAQADFPALERFLEQIKAKEQPFMEHTVTTYVSELKAELDKLDTTAFDRVIDILLAVYRRDGQVFIAGNGGSAGTANHFVCDFGKNAVAGDRRRFRVLSVSDNVEKITALGNDIAFDQIFRFQLGNLMRPGDALIVISASGNSPDLVQACEYAKGLGCPVIALSGFGGGKICDGADAVLKTDMTSYERIEDLHMSILHMIVCWFKEHQEALSTDN